MVDPCGSSDLSTSLRRGHWGRRAGPDHGESTEDRHGQQHRTRSAVGEQGYCEREQPGRDGQRQQPAADAEAVVAHPSQDDRRDRLHLRPVLPHLVSPRSARRALVAAHCARPHLWHNPVPRPRPWPAHALAHPVGQELRQLTRAGIMSMPAVSTFSPKPGVASSRSCSASVRGGAKWALEDPRPTELLVWLMK